MQIVRIESIFYYHCHFNRTKNLQKLKEFELECTKIHFNYVKIAECSLDEPLPLLKA